MIDGSYSFDKSQGNLGEFVDTEIYNYQISPRYTFQHNLNQIQFDNILGLILFMQTIIPTEWTKMAIIIIASTR